MAADLAPASYPPWILEKQTKTAGDSPSSIQSSSVFFDADEKIRIPSTQLAEMSSTLTEPFNNQIEPFLEQEYQSSEEALSPMLDDMEHSDEEQEMEPAIVEDGLWNDVKCSDLDMAIAIYIIAAGQPKMVNLGHYSSPHIRSNRPDRISPPPPAAPARSRERLPSMKVRTQFSNESLRHYTFSSSSDEETHEDSDAASEGSLADSPALSPVELFEPPLVTSQAKPPIDSPMDDVYVSEKRHESIHSVRHPDILTTWSPPPSKNEKEKKSVEVSPVTPLFLQNDPFENKSISGKSASSKSSHSRFRSISTKFSIFGLNKQDAKSEEPKKQTKKERRNSLFRPLTPQSMGPNPNQEKSRNSSRAESPQAALVAPRQPSSRESTFANKRMVARAANEREPAIVIPPCPPNYDVVDEPVQLLQSSTFAPRERNREDSLRRRKSLLGMVPH